MGFELVLSASGAHFTGFEGDAERLPGLLSAAAWTNLRVTWGDGYIALLREGSEKPLLVQDFPDRQRGRDGQPGVRARAYALSGRGLLWSVPSCAGAGNSTEDCPVHTASRETFSRSDWNGRHPGPRRREGACRSSRLSLGIAKSEKFRKVFHILVHLSIFFSFFSENFRR